MAKLWERTASPSGKSRLDEINMATIEPGIPLILFLPGLFTTNDTPQNMSGSLRIIKDLLKADKSLPENLKVYCLSYDSSLKTAFNAVSYFYNPWGTAPFNEPKNVAYNFIIKRVASDVSIDSDGHVHGTPLPKEAAEKNLRNLTLHGYSAGTFFMHHMYHSAIKMMAEIGYPKETARDLLKEIVTLSVGNMSHPRLEKNRFTSVCLVGRNDVVTRWKDIIVNPLTAVYNKYSRRLSIKPLSENYLLVAASIKRKLWERKQKDDGTKELTKIPPLLFPAWSPLRSNHEYQHFLTVDDRHNSFSKIVLSVLANAVKRTERLKPEQLLKPAGEGFFGKHEMDAYKERIQKALKNPKYW